MRVRVVDDSLLGDLCDYLSLQRYTAVEASEDQADVLTSSAPPDLQAATKLMFEIGIWRAKHGSVEVSVDPRR